MEKSGNVENARARLTLAGLAIFACAASSPATAADIPVNARATAAAMSSYNWSGFYVGLNAGAGRGHSSTPTSTVFHPAGYFGAASVPAVNSAGAGISTNTRGFTGGVQAGYNWQSGNLVAGIEVEFDYFGQKGSNTTSGVYPGGATFTIASSVRADWLFTARPRLGMATSNWLWYATGGLAVTKLKADWTFNDAFPGLNAAESASASATKAGWVIGGGVETALPGKLSLGVEYLYVKFPSISATSTNLTSVGGAFAFPMNVFTHSADLSSSIVRVRLNKPL